jgi:hypothetical protein
MDAATKTKWMAYVKMEASSAREDDLRFAHHNRIIEASSARTEWWFNVDPTFAKLVEDRNQARISLALKNLEITRYLKKRAEKA